MPGRPHSLTLARYQANDSSGYAGIYEVEWTEFTQKDWQALADLIHFVLTSGLRVFTPAKPSCLIVLRKTRYGFHDRISLP